MRVLIFGLPGSGKTYLAERLVEYLGDNVAWFNADKVREEADDWDFSDTGRLRQNQRMIDLCVAAEIEGKVAIADFVAPFETARNKFFADYEIFVDTIEEGRFEDTNKMFIEPKRYDYRVTEKNAELIAIQIAKKINGKKKE